MRFADIPGHDDVKRRLREMADTGHIPHALLLEGPAGAGKFMLARAFAQYIHCTNRTSDGDSCGVCTACRQHDAFNHIDTVFTFPVVKKKGGGVSLSDDFIEDFRTFITEHPFMDFEHWLTALDNINAQPQIYVEEGAELLRRLTYMARQSQFKVVLMWLPERMKEETANKLLKLIEEPFGDTIFLMVSNNPRAILPTIYSRTQRIEVRRYDTDELEEILHSYGCSWEQARDLARVSEGNVNLALRLSDMSEERTRQFELFATLMRKAYQRNVLELRKWSEEVAKLGRETSMQFIDYATRLIRESFLTHLHVRELLTLDSRETDFVAKFFPFINDKNVEELIALFDDARRDIAGNGNAKIVFFDLAVRVIMLIRRK